MKPPPTLRMHRLFARTLGLTLLASCSPSPRVARAPAPSQAECQVRELERLAKSGFRPGMSLDSLREAELDSAMVRFRERRRPTTDTARLDRTPKLLNAESIQRWMSLNYPPALGRQGIGGSTLLVFFAPPDSTPKMVRVLRSSGRSELDVASVDMIQIARMAPGIYHGCPVWTVVSMPINWNPGRPPRGGVPPR